MNILAIPGSLRKKSFNKAICYSMKELVSKGIDLEVFELNSIPLFNEDLESNLPQSVKELVSAAEKADAIILATPEYDNQVPGPLKTATEWLHRDYSAGAIRNKPVGIVGCSTGGFGTVRAQNQLMLLANILKLKVHADLRLPVSEAHKKFDEETGQLKDESTRQKIADFLERLVEFSSQE